MAIKYEEFNGSMDEQKNIEKAIQLSLTAASEKPKLNFEVK